jgi:NAD+ diphosphatase
MKKKPENNDLYFIMFKGNFLLKRDGVNLIIPTYDEINKLNIKFEYYFFIGEFDGKACFATEAESELSVQEHFELISLRDIGILADEELFSIAGRANQILNWDRTHRFCGKCGSKTENKKDEIAKICPNCNNVMYPVICPAIIVAITRGDKILLAHNKGFKDKMYSLIAGFVEAGEDLESAVKREILEEVGIEVKNVTYYKSAPWPFPNSLMLGFFAEYESGEIKVDGEEITDAGWFSKDEFPNLPQKFSLARNIIDKFIERNE